MVLGYVFFIKGNNEPEANLVASSGSSSLPNMDGSTANATPDAKIAQDFLDLLLSVKNIKLDDSIFSEAAWDSLKDSSIELIPPGDEGRPNPFAPFGSDPAPLVSGEASLSAPASVSPVNAAPLPASPLGAQATPQRAQ
jgi:hypothetical protein